MSKADYFKLETEMELLKQREEPQQEMEVAYVETIERLEEELRRTKNKTKFEDKIEALKAENEKIREQYNNMYTRYTRLEQRFKDEEKETYPFDYLESYTGTSTGRRKNSSASSLKKCKDFPPGSRPS